MAVRGMIRGRSWAPQMAEYEQAIRARRAVTPDGVRPVTVAVRAGRIAALAGLELAGRKALAATLRSAHAFPLCASDESLHDSDKRRHREPKMRAFD